MSYQVFARKYRPKTFKDVLGQDHVIQTLRNAIEQERLAHAYLFVGPRGTGKTSTARILAKALNCSNGPSIDFDPDEDICQEIAEGRSLDVLEIDGASNNGVDQVRDLRDNVRFAPSRCRYKIIYIDEVHMLTTQAFNALLKTLEEPPEHVKFIFATTEPNKILPTIISRCQRFDLRPIATQTIADHLIYIAQNEGVELEKTAAWTVAKGAEGGMRDAQSMLDQLVAFCGTHITEENVLDVFGFTSRETVAKLTSSILGKNTSAALKILHEQASSGKELGQLLDDLIGCLRSLLVTKVDPASESDGIPVELWQPLVEASSSVPTDRLLNLIDIFANTEARMKWATNKKLHFEIGLIKAIQSLNDARISDVIKALAGAGPVEIPAEKQVSKPAPESKKEVAVVLEQKDESPASSSVQETPSSPAPSAIVEKTAVVEPEPQKAKDSIVGLDALIAEAPEQVAQPAPEPAAIANRKAVAAVKTPSVEEVTATEETEEDNGDEEFYQDPLIQKALKLFQATLAS